MAMNANKKKKCDAKSHFTSTEWLKFGATYSYFFWKASGKFEAVLARRLAQSINPKKQQKGPTIFEPAGLHLFDECDRGSRSRERQRHFKNFCTMSGRDFHHHHQEALDELIRDIQDAYNEELHTSQNADTLRSSVRNVRPNNSDGDAVPSRMDVLESWRSLAFALEELGVFGRYTSSLESLFAMDIPDPAIWRHVKVLLDLMTDTVIHHDADEVSTECRYITLLEILSSFRQQSWSPSKQIQDEWSSFNEPIPLDMTPTQFRKAAYNVLMSLPWVPSSHGLKEACMINEKDDDAENEHSMSFDPSAVDQSIFDQIRGVPLPRVDYIHRLLVKFDGTPTTGSITAMSKDDPTSTRGIGKTTLACMLASHHKIQSQYNVFWLRLNHDRQAEGGLSCSKYITYLDSLCKQIGQTTIKWPEQIRVLEETSFRQKREERRMQQVKRIMADVLVASSGASRPILLVLDDVNYNQEMEWFRFVEHQSMLMTTNNADLNVDWTLEMDVLSEDEALDLFLAEAEFPLDHVLSTSLEAQTTVERCGYHPLVVRTASRWFHLKQATAGFVKGLEELDQELSSCIARLRYCRPLSSTTHLLTEIMDLMLSPLSASGHPTTLMKLSLASMAVVFRGGCVPLDAVQLLWGELLRTDPDAIQELGNALSPSQLQKRARFISEALISLGMLSVTESSEGRFVEIHHELQMAYARRLAQDMQVRNTEIRLSRLWHEAFVKAYISRRMDNDDDDAEDNCRVYAMDKLVNHMVEGKMLQKAASLLMDKHFLEQRLSIKGIEVGAQTHLEDCAVLYRAIKAEGGDDPRQILLSILLETSTFLVAKASRLLDRDAISDIATTIHRIGFALAGRKFLSKASSQYKNALKLLTKSNPLAGTLYYSLSAINLEKKDVAKAQKNIKSCFKVMACNGDTQHPYYREALLLNGDIQVEASNYRGALKCYNEAIRFLSEDQNAYQLELGIVLGRKASLLLVMGDAEEAMEVAQDATKTKEEMNECSHDLGLLYRLLGDIHGDACNDDEAERYYIKAIRVWEPTADKVNQEDILMTNGRISYLHGDTSQCFGSFCDAIKTVKSPRIDDLCWFARKYSSEGENDKAISVLREALTLTVGRPDSLERASLLFHLGSCYVAQEDFLRALSSLDKSLDIRARILGESETTLQTIELIGEVHLREGATEEAVKRYNEALQLAESMYGEDNERVASILFSLGQLKLGNGESADGQALLVNCMELRRKHLGPNHPDLASVLERLAEIHFDQGMYDKAYKYHSECLKIRQANFAADDPLLADSMHSMGKVTRKRGDCERGLHFLLDALHIRSNLKDQQAACDTLLEIGHLHRQSRDPESAAGCYQKCLEILVANLRYHSECGAAVYLSLGHAHKDLGQTEDAMHNYEKALTIRRDLLGQDHTLTAAVYRSLGIMEFQLGRYDDAMEHLVEFLRIHNVCEQANASIDYVLALLFLGDMYQRSSKSDEAKSSWTTALQAFQQPQTDISNKCPELGPQLERRLNQLEKAREEARERRANNRGGGGGMKREGSVFARISADLVGRLSDEQLPVNTKVTPTTTEPSSTTTTATQQKRLERDPEEEEIHNSIFLDG
jgi:tetratricopeptide (TPR) repeat protein